MSTDAKSPSGVDQSVAQLVYTHTRHIESVPRGETFLKRDLPAEVQEVFRRFTEAGIIKQVGYDSEAQVHRWRLNERVLEALDRVSAAPKPGQRVSPCCAYRGFSNLRDGGFECGFCGGEFEEFVRVEEVDDGR